MLDLLQSNSLKSALRFDYNQIAADVREQVVEAALDIRQRINRVQDDVLATGQRLIEIKDVLQHGQFQDWVQTEFGFSQRTAQNFMNVAERFAGKSETVSLFSDSALYLLAAPSTPDEAIAAAIEEAKATGASPTKERTKAIIAVHKPAPAVPEPIPPHWGQPANQDGGEMASKIVRLEMKLLKRGWGIQYAPAPQACYVVKGAVKFAFFRDNEQSKLSALKSAENRQIADEMAAKETNAQAPAADEADEEVWVNCPRCGAEQQDADGFGVLHCEACGYCVHPSLTDGVCGLCGQRQAEPTVTPTVPTSIRAAQLVWAAINAQAFDRPILPNKIRFVKSAPFAVFKQFLVKGEEVTDETMLKALGKVEAMLTLRMANCTHAKIGADLRCDDCGQRQSVPPPDSRLTAAGGLVVAIETLLSQMDAYGQLTGKYLHVPPAERALKAMRDELQSLIDTLSR